MSEQNQPAPQAVTIPEGRRSILMTMASRFGMEPAAFEATLRGTVMKRDKDGNEATKEEFAAFLVVANQYNLNPLTKEIYAFSDRQRGGIIPIVSVDGWIRIINEHPNFDGVEFDDHLDERGNLVAVTARVFRKDRSHPTTVTEYMAECRRDTVPWKTWPRRMLRHKALIQGGRYAFGFSGIYDEDEGERIRGARDITPRDDRAAISSVQQRLLESNAQAPIDIVQHVDRETGEITQSQDRGSPQTTAAVEGSSDSQHASEARATPEEPTLSPRERGRAHYHGGGKRRDIPADLAGTEGADAFVEGFDEAKEETEGGR